MRFKHDTEKVNRIKTKHISSRPAGPVAQSKAEAKLLEEANSKSVPSSTGEQPGGGRKLISDKGESIYTHTMGKKARSVQVPG